jgi:hypothetical protein
LSQQSKQQGSNNSGANRPKRAKPGVRRTADMPMEAQDPEQDLEQEQERSLSARVTGLAQEAAEGVATLAGSGASRLSHRVTNLLDEKMASGVDIVSHIARTTRTAADDLDEDIPQVADAIRSVADSVDDYAERLRERSVEDLIGSAAQFTRQQPGLVFGAAALLGFLVFRAFSSSAGPAVQQSMNNQGRQRQRASNGQFSSEVEPDAA